MNSSDKMSALVLTEENGELTLQQIDVPPMADDQVLVEIYASGVNPVDIKIKTGKAAHARHPLPAVLGMDLAGKVVRIGAEVKNFRIGDHVYGFTGGIGGVQGSLAEYAAVDAELLAPMPDNIPMTTAAAVPLIFITAWEGLVDRAKIASGQKVLIHGGAGGVGHMAVQIAKAFGAKVYATATGPGLEKVRLLGATAIDYTIQTVEEYVDQYTGGEGFDIVYDTVGGETLDLSFKAVKNYTGHVVSCLGWGKHALAPLSFKGASYSGVFTMLPLLTGKGKQHHGEILREATKLIQTGKLVVFNDPNLYKLSDVDTAHELVSQGRSNGKVVIAIK